MKKHKKQQIQKLVLNITAPIKMDSEIELKSLAVFVGQNDSGKTLILKIAYALATIGCSPANPVKMEPKQGAQFIFDNVFTDQNFNGSLKAIYTEGSVTVELHEGTVVNVEITDLANPLPMIFMSTDMRTFDQMCLYLRMREQAGADPVIFMKTMLGAYRLYDVTYMESLIARCPITFPDSLRNTLKSGFDFKESITALEVDLEKCEFHAVLEDGSKKNVATYGKGHQAILNMFLGVGA